MPAGSCRGARKFGFYAGGQPTEMMAASFLYKASTARSTQYMTCSTKDRPSGTTSTKESDWTASCSKRPSQSARRLTQETDVAGGTGSDARATRAKLRRHLSIPPINGAGEIWRDGGQRNQRRLTTPFGLPHSVCLPNAKAHILKQRRGKLLKALQPHAGNGCTFAGGGILCAISWGE